MSDRSHLTGAVHHWPTPRAEDGEQTGGHRGVPDTLTSAVRLWPTPDASCGRPHEGNVRLLRAKVLAGELTEEEAQGMLHGGKSAFQAQGKIPAMWPTPSARDWRSGKASQETLEGNARPLNEVVAAREQLPTPTPQRRTGLQSHGVNVVEGGLSPDWTEFLMGFPRGWTSLEPLPGLTDGKTECPASPPASPTGSTASASSATGGLHKWRLSLWHALHNFYGRRKPDA